MIGQVVGSYEIVELLGHGSVGIVYTARDAAKEAIDSSHLVALKVKGKDHKDHGYQKNPFVKEFEILTEMYTMNPSCFVQPLECNTTESVHFLATELMDETLDAWGTRLRKTMPTELNDQVLNTIISKLSSTVDALTTAHTLGYSIRDISSRNFLVKDNMVKAIDLSSAIRVTCDTTHPDSRVTPRYSSCNVVVGGRVRFIDDYEALCYLWLDVLTNRLAWRKCKKPSIIRDIKRSCLDMFTECYANLPPLLTTMLCGAKDCKESCDFKDCHNKIIEYVKNLQPNDIVHIITNFKDNSTKFSIYDGVF